MAILAIALCLTGCMEPSGAAPAMPDAAAQRTFNPEQVEAARALLIGSRQSGTIGSEEQSDVLCVIALESIEAQFSDSVLISDTQRQAFSEVKSFYDRKARSGLDEEEFEEMKSSLEAQYPDVRARLQISLGCVQVLAP